MATVAFSQAVKSEAVRLGFDHCRIVPVGEAPHADFYDAWLALGRAGEMTYLARHTEKRRNPALLAESGASFRSMIVLAVNYHQFDPPPEVRNDPRRGLIARYAWGDDYHELIRPLLYALDAFVALRSGRQSQGKCLVDTGPVLERDWAQLAGIGFTGKNCCTIHPLDGSWLLLATLLVPELLAYDPPPRPHDPVAVTPLAVAAGLPGDRMYGTWTIELTPAASAGGDAPVRAARQGTCGHCTRCLDGCPTGAFTGAYHLDAQRCIAYWTIETDGPIPLSLRPHFGNRIFGCDICQEDCPYNRQLALRAPRLAGLQAHAGRVAPPLLEGFQVDNPYWLNQEAFSEHFRRSPIKRARRHGMLRNVCVALGNWGNPAAVPALAMALNDLHPVVRTHAAWALGQVQRHDDDAGAAALLTTALAGEEDARVREAIHLALDPVRMARP